MTEFVNGNGGASAPPAGLRATIEAARLDLGCSLKALTVLATQHDPFRLDTPANHRDGEWLAVQAESLGFGDRIIHLRGVHYVLVSSEVAKPNGEPYRNIEADWKWLQENAAKAARFLGYIEFDRIFDARNAEPVTTIWEPPSPHGYITVGVEVAIPSADEIKPQVQAHEFVGTQPYKLVIVGEKTSLREIVSPIAERHAADLYLPTGEISDTQIYTMAKIAADDGRRMIVFYLSDCDPAGWQMAISVARKLQAFRAGLFPELDYEIRPVALTPAQVREYGLPSTPLKPEEKRGDDWRAAYGIEQTEIDALAALNPDLLRRLLRAALKPFFDYGLDDRVRQAHEQWRREAQAALDAGMDPDVRATLADDLSERLDDLRDQIEALNDDLRAEIPDGIELPAIEIPEAEIGTEVNGKPLIDSDWTWVEQTRRLIATRAYEEADR